MFSSSLSGAVIGALSLLNVGASSVAPGFSGQFDLDGDGHLQAPAGGSFYRSLPSPAVLKLSEIEPGVWAVIIRYLASPRADEGCLVMGLGRLADGRLQFSRRFDETVGVGNDADLEVTVDGDRASVSAEMLDRGCEADQDPSGEYQRETSATPPESSEGPSGLEKPFPLPPKQPSSL